MELAGGVWGLSCLLLLENASTRPWRPGGYSDFGGNPVAVLAPSSCPQAVSQEACSGLARAPLRGSWGSPLNSYFDPGSSRGNAPRQDEAAGGQAAAAERLCLQGERGGAS